MTRNGVDVIHLATGLIVGYPPARGSVFSEISLRKDTVSALFLAPIRSHRNTIS
jgi:hypothetical protein